MDIYIMPKSLDFQWHSANGLAYRAHWDVIEPTEGQYNWDPIDKALGIAQKANKEFALGITPGQYTPKWVYADGAQSFYWQSGNQVLQAPLPWDLVYQTKWFAFLQTVATRYDKELSRVDLTGIASKDKEIWLPQKLDGSHWPANVNDQLVTTWTTLLNFFNTMFTVPFAAAHVRFALPQPDITSSLIAIAIADYPERYILEWDGWASRPMWSEISDNTGLITIGLQEGAPVGTAIIAAMTQAENVGASYVELFEDDLALLG